MAVYAVSDLHGQYAAFLKGLEEIGFSDNDELIVIGDAVDRGPDGIALLKHIMDHENMDLLIGNHELMMMNAVDPEGEPVCTGEVTELWTEKNGGNKTFEKYEKLTNDERKEILNWLNSRYVVKTLEIGGKKFCLTHSFYIPGCENKLIGELDSEDTWQIVWKSMFRDGKTYCEDIYKDHDYTFITGHVPVQYVRYKKLHTGDYAELKPYEHGNFIDIDGGCALGNEYEIDNGALFFRLDDMKAFGIKLK